MRPVGDAHYATIFYLRLDADKSVLERQKKNGEYESRGKESSGGCPQIIKRTPFDIVGTLIRHFEILGKNKQSISIYY